MLLRRLFVRCDCCWYEKPISWHSISTELRSSIRKDGWFVTRDGKHFCSKRCLRRYREKERSNCDLL